MNNDSCNAFVRARPRKITLIENYFYKAEVQDSLNFQFEEADGEINVEVVYDGEDRDVRWKIRQFLVGLTDSSRPLEKMWNFIQSFFRWGLIRWLTRWTGLAALWRAVRDALLGLQPGDKYFGIAAIKDVAQQGQALEKACSGRLMLHGYKPSSFAEEWPTRQTIPLAIPVVGLKRKLESSQKCALTYTYRPAQPNAAPLHVRSVCLTDAGLEKRGQLHSEYDEVLSFEICLKMDLGQPKLDDEDKVPFEMIKHWLVDAKEPLKGEETGRHGQIYLLNVDDLENKYLIRRALYSLALDQGGYILIDVTKVKDLDETQEELKKRVLQITFEEGPVFVPVFEPYYRSEKNEKVIVIPVPLVPPRWYENGRTQRDKDYPSHLWVKSPVTKTLLETIRLPDESDRDKTVCTELAEIMAALANSDGGSIFLQIPKNTSTNIDEVPRKWLGTARWLCWPPLSLLLMKLEKVEDRGWYVEIERSLEIHSVHDRVFRYENGEVKSLSTQDKEDADQIYTLIKERCKLSYPVIETRPSIHYANVRGPRLEAREQQGARFDQEDGVLKWTQVIPFEVDVKAGAYLTSLSFLVNRPVELYRQPDLSGRVQVILNDRALSGLNVAYFNALGGSTRVPVEKKSQIWIRFDHITLQQVFRRREFRARRELQFEGIKPDYNRLEDIRGMLADLGLEYIQTRLADSFWNQFRLEYLPVDIVMKQLGGYRIRGERPDGLWISLDVKGEKDNISRERKEGERTERMRLRSGHMRISIYGGVEGEFAQAQELSRLMNHLQQLLKERLSYVRVQVA
jgi:hypothetical protein